MSHGPNQAETSINKLPVGINNPLASAKSTIKLLRSRIHYLCNVSRTSYWQCLNTSLETLKWSKQRVQSDRLFVTKQLRILFMADWIRYRVNATYEMRDVRRHTFITPHRSRATDARPSSHPFADTGGDRARPLGEIKGLNSRQRRSL